MALEINLVPDIKNEMIKTLKLRNLIFFVCIMVVIASIVVTAIFGTIMGGQQLAIDGKKNTISTLSKKLTDFTDLSDYLTIKNQLSSLSTITDNKKVLSRTFNILYALIPHGADTITISELNVNLSSDDPTFTFDAQANANSAPYIDYNVLDSFKKSMQYMRYDYGRYIDKNGDEIPAYCIIESAGDGSVLSDADRGFYGLWTIYGEGCNPFAANYGEEGDFEDDEGNANNESNENNANANNANNANDEPDVNDYASNYNGTDLESTVVVKTSEYTEQIKDAGYELEELSSFGLYATDYNLDRYEGGEVVRIWRTPQYSAWYKDEEKEDEPYMDLEGHISNVAHFESQCITYTGVVTSGSSVPKWTETNDSCLLVPDGTKGIKITESSNGRTSSSDLVLRFSAIITLTPEVYKFNNYHMLALSPSGHYNVTDSYVQIQAMFSERAEDCGEDDTLCRSAASYEDDDETTDSTNSTTDKTTDANKDTNKDTTDQETDLKSDDATSDKTLDEIFETKKEETTGV